MSTDPAASTTSTVCTACGAPLAEGFAFCESCGHPTGAGAPVPAAPATSATDTADSPDAAPAADDVVSARTTLLAHPTGDVTEHTEPPHVRCSCGGTFEDGWCDTCGAPQPDERDHVVVTVAPALGAVSDRGVVHHRNEDAGTVATLGAAVACIVCDGVSNVEGSQEASAAAVEATAGTLTEASAAGAPDPAEGWFPALRQARRAAAVAAAACTHPGARDAASCTWAAAITDGTTVWASNVGDSRLYLVGDDGRGRQLGTDHSWAAEAVAAGADPATVMQDSRAHMITAWMGADAPELPDSTTQVPVEGPGWLVACSDGLWNYCEDGDELAALIGRLGGATIEATALAEALVGFACAAGGADNITVAAARVSGRPLTDPDPDPTPTPAPAPDAGAGPDEPGV